jgi:hypothetical protein
MFLLSCFVFVCFLLKNGPCFLFYYYFILQLTWIIAHVTYVFGRFGKFDSLFEPYNATILSIFAAFVLGDFLALQSRKKKTSSCNCGPGTSQPAPPRLPPSLPPSLPPPQKKKRKKKKKK